MSLFRPGFRIEGEPSRRPRSGVKAASDRSKSKLIRRISAFENMEERCLMAVYSPVAVTPLSPLPTEGQPLAPNIVLARFDSASPIADLSATVSFNGATAIPTTIVAAGTEFVPVIGNTPEYFVELPTGSFTAPGASLGNLQFNVHITDSSDTTTAAVPGSSPVAFAPLTVNSTTASLTAVAGTPLTAVTLATFTDGFTTAPASDFTGTIDWGDGSPESAATFVPSGTPGQFLVQGTHTYSSPQTASIKLTVNDLNGSTGFSTAAIPATISAPTITLNPAPAIAATQNVPLTNVVVGTFTDTNTSATPADFAASVVDFGDGSTAPATVIETGVAGGVANFSVLASHTYTVTEPAGTNLTLSVQDITGTPAAPAQTVTTPVTSTAPPLLIVATGATVTGTEDTPIGDEQIATFTSSDPASTVADFSAFVEVALPNDEAVEVPGAGESAGTITQPGGAGTPFIVTDPDLNFPVGTYAITVSIYTPPAGFIIPAVADPTAVAIAHSQAVIADAPLSPNPTQPTVATTEAAKFTGAVAEFVDANLSASPTDFIATVNWGDDTPTQPGVVSQTGGNGTPFFVSASHTYANSGVNGGFGSYVITVTVHDIGGAATTVTNTASVADRVLTIQGTLNPSSDTGVSKYDGLTNDVTPNFTGTTSEAGATIDLYAQAASGGGYALIGQGVSNAAKAWSITTYTLPQGSWNVFARATDSFGHTISALTPVQIGTSGGPLVIDTVGPKITNVFFNRLAGQIDFTIQDNLVGVNIATLVDASNYQFAKLKSSLPGTYQISNVSVTPEGAFPTSPDNVVLTINGAKSIRGGFYLFTIHSGGNGTSEVQDVAGNALDGEFYGTFPSGNNVAGGNFVAELDAIHDKIFAPATVVGQASPTIVGIAPPKVTVINNAATRAAALKAEAAKVAALKAEAHAATLARLAALAKRRAVK